MKMALKDGWELTGSYPGFWAFGRSMELNLELRGVVPWIPVEVPSSVHWELHRAGLLPDPYYGANAPACEWVNERDWLYRTSFVADEAWRGKRVRLVLEGVDYSARVLLNGEGLGAHAGMFTPGVFELSDALRYGEENKLVVVLEKSPDGVAQLGHTDRVDHLKSRFGYRWDFCPRLVHVGLWKPVVLDIAEWCVLDDVAVEAVPDAAGAGKTETDRVVSGSAGGRTADGGTVEVRAVVDSERTGRYRIRTEVYDPGGRLAAATETEGTAVRGLQTVRQGMRLEDVRLWWPNGYGEQPLYRVKVELEAIREDDAWARSDVFECAAGFRTLSFRANPGAPADALPYTVAVNDRPIYIKGWNWVPQDQLYGRAHEAQLRHRLTLARRANVNMLRVWGGGLIERELFYELCDEFGILIWQEMMQSSSGFNNEPAASPSFLHLVSATMRQVIREKRNHPSLAIWCGGNELTEGGHLDARLVPLTDKHPNLRLLRDLVSDLDSSRLFLPSSSSGPTFFLDRQHNGKGIQYDVHGPWKYAGAADHYRLYNTSDALLHSEYGGDGFASMESMRRFLPPELLDPGQSQSIAWLLHGYEYWNMDGQLAALFGGGWDSLEQMAMAAQWLQAEGIRYAVEANRRRAPHCSGSLLWQFNEPYPNVSCTSAVDYFGDPKLAYGWVAKANRNRHVSLAHEGLCWRAGEAFSATAHVTDEGEGLDQEHLTVKWTAYTPDGSLLAQGEWALGEAEGLTTRVGELAFVVPEAGMFIIRLRLEGTKDGGLSADNEYVFSVQGDGERPPLAPLVEGPETKLTWTVAERDGSTVVTVANAGETAALWVRVAGIPSADDCMPVVRPLDDGFVLLPGETAERTFDGVKPETCAWEAKALNAR
ncbi:glycoside hydrolase family 2 protein [Cohnella sp. GCM10012308]|uniref:glycoside hydrolase family 2 protein n=1 Tax=Cohnella sp. GCM10012308 TaxID=3317329 RepID=UPI0036157249